MSQSPTDSENLSALIALLREECGRLDLPERLMAARRAISGRVVFTTSFGIEDQAIVHAVFGADLEIDVVTLDTGRSFRSLWRFGTKRNAATAGKFAPDPTADALRTVPPVANHCLARVPAFSLRRIKCKT